MTILDILFFLLSSLGILYVFLWRFRQYRLDKFRQDVFLIRDELFDFAAQGKISFNHPAYVTLRNLMNGYIRFSHRISLLQVIVHLSGLFDSKYDPKPFEETWEEASKGLDENTKNELELFRIRATANLVYHILFSSLIMKIVVIPIIFILYIKHKLTIKEQAIILGGENDKPQEITVVTYQYTERHSEQVKGFTDHLNADAFAFGSLNTTVVSV